MNDEIVRNVVELFAKHFFEVVDVIERSYIGRLNTERPHGEKNGGFICIDGEPVMTQTFKVVLIFHSIRYVIKNMTIRSFVVPLDMRRISESTFGSHVLLIPFRIFRNTIGTGALPVSFIAIHMPWDSLKNAFASVLERTFIWYFSNWGAYINNGICSAHSSWG